VKKEKTTSFGTEKFEVKPLGVVGQAAGKMEKTFFLDLMRCSQKSKGPRGGFRTETAARAAKKEIEISSGRPILRSVLSLSKVTFLRQRVTEKNIAVERKGKLVAFEGGKGKKVGRAHLLGGKTHRPGSKQ